VLDRRFVDGDAAYLKVDREFFLPPNGKPGLSFFPIAPVDERAAGALRQYDFSPGAERQRGAGGLRDYQAAYWLRQIMGDRKICGDRARRKEQLASDAVSS